MSGEVPLVQLREPPFSALFWKVCVYRCERGVYKYNCTPCPADAVCYEAVFVSDTKCCPDPVPVKRSFSFNFGY